MSKSKPKPPRHKPLTHATGVFTIHDEIEGQSDRATAITALAYVENNLVLAIMTRLRVLNDTDQKLLFEDEHGAMQDFASKVDIGYALNLYGHPVREDLHRLRKIRNKFAHDPEVRSFDHPLVSKYSDDLVGVSRLDLPNHLKGTVLNRRQRFVELCYHLATRFSLEKPSEHRPLPSVNRIGPDY